MAYPTLDSAYGFKPINLLGGTSYSGSTRRIPIDSAYNVAMFNGDLVTIAANGTATRITAQTDIQIAGVFLGVEYTNAQEQLEFAQYYPGTSVSNAFAVVADNPSLLCKVAIVDSAGAIDNDVVLRAVVGSNADVEQALPGQTSTGNSRLGILATSFDVTATHPIRIIDLVEETKVLNADGNSYYVEAIVKFNTHQYTTTTGI
tara:strand:- start:65 stop:673 length:609 start_codon:yes stop_codon:yes gene_type:complete